MPLRKTGNDLLTAFLNRVELTPGRPFLVSGGCSFTFLEVFTAARLLSSLAEVDFDRRSALVFAQRGPDAVTAFIASWMIGCYYVPIDVRWPRRRIDHIISRCKPSVLFYSTETEDVLDVSPNGTRTIHFSTRKLLQNSGVLSRVDLVSFPKDVDPAYCIFTSGSTGLPKGVLISHESICNYIKWFSWAFNLSSETKFSSMSQLHFDISTVDIYTPFLSGGCTYFLPDKEIRFPLGVPDFLIDNNIDSLMTVPSFLNIMSLHRIFDSKDAKSDVPLKRIFFAGEPPVHSSLRYLKSSLPDVTLVNMYGPTEATVTCTHYQIESDRLPDVIPIGRESIESTVWLLAENQGELTQISPQDEGIIGEIYISGSGLALGYLGDKDATERSFIEMPAKCNLPSRLYKTGDLASFDHNGNLVFKGRVDLQIKKDGYRIELGEIESVLDGFPLILDRCAVYDHESKKILVAIVTLASPEVIQEFCATLKQQCPRYMLPSQITVVERLPMTSTGKVDRQMVLEVMRSRAPKTSTDLA